MKTLLMRLFISLGQDLIGTFKFKYLPTTFIITPLENGNFFFSIKEIHYVVRDIKACDYVVNQYWFNYSF